MAGNIDRRRQRRRRLRLRGLTFSGGGHGAQEGHRSQPFNNALIVCLLRRHNLVQPLDLFQAIAHCADWARLHSMVSYTAKTREARPCNGCGAPLCPHCKLRKKTYLQRVVQLQEQLRPPESSGSQPGRSEGTPVDAAWYLQGRETTVSGPKEATINNNNWDPRKAQPTHIIQKHPARPFHVRMLTDMGLEFTYGEFTSGE